MVGTYRDIYIYIHSHTHVYIYISIGCFIKLRVKTFLLDWSLVNFLVSSQNKKPRSYWTRSSTSEDKSWAICSLQPKVRDWKLIAQDPNMIQNWHCSFSQVIIAWCVFMFHPHLICCFCSKLRFKHSHRNTKSAFPLNVVALKPVFCMGL